MKKKETGDVEGAGEMGRERVDGDHEVELSNNGGQRNEATVGEQRRVAEPWVFKTAPLVTQGAAL
jgi:hypothetical protein